MFSTLEELYMGNIGFDVKFYEKDSDYSKAVHKAWENEKKLVASFNEEQKEWFDQYGTGKMEKEDIVKYDVYLDALKFGIRLMAEVFVEGGNREP